MSHLLTLIKKEMKELLTPASIIPIIIMAVIFASLGNITGGAIAESQETEVTLAILNLDSDVSVDSLSLGAIDWMQDKGGVFISYQDHDPEKLAEAKQAMRDTEAAALLVFPEDFTSKIKGDEVGVIDVYWNMKGTGMFDTLSSAPVYGVIASISAVITEKIYGGGQDLGFLMSPLGYNSTTILADREMAGIDPMTVSGLLESQSMMMPILIMIIIVMVGGIIISSMGMEKENKTLETLLTLPVDRTTIVTGKLIGSAAVGLIFGLVYMVGMGYYVQGFNIASADVDLAQYGLSMGLMDWGLLAIMMFLAILCALGMCMILGAFAKNYKAAQSLTLPISFLAMVPMFVVMFTDFHSLPLFLQGLIFAIPFSHPMMGMSNLMLGHDALVYGGLTYLALFTLATILITVRLYKSDILLTGVRFDGLKKRFAKRSPEE